VPKGLGSEKKSRPPKWDEASNKYKFSGDIKDAPEKLSFKAVSKPLGPPPTITVGPEEWEKALFPWGVVDSSMKNSL
jgi:hypothetical protein